MPPAVTEIPPSLVSSAYYYYDLTLMCKIAEILKKTEDLPCFKFKSDKTKIHSTKGIINPNEFSYSIGRQGANVFPLAFGLVPEQLEKSV